MRLDLINDLINGEIKIDKFKLWKLKQIDERVVENLSRQAQIGLFIARVLVSRGITTAEEYLRLINPGISQFFDPFLLKDMDIAVNRIILAINNKEKVLIYGDYDVDGITSTASMILFLEELGLKVDFHIPDRQEHGYGLSIKTLKEVKEKGYNLIISVDCGISAFEEVNYINENGMDIIITDHHICKDKLPNATAIVATSRDDCNYPFKFLAGGGVVFKLMHAISMTMKCENLFLKYLDLVALGTVADMVKLTDENRAIVSKGIENIQQSCNTGLRALIDSVDTGDKQNQISSWIIAFVLAPRINAAGRVNDAAKAVELLISSDYERALEISKELNGFNSFRKITEQQITTDAIAMVNANPRFQKDKVLVISNKSWHQGVIGIVASRLVEKFYKPVIIISVSGNDGKGSARSIEGFNIYEALTSCAHLLERYGGHAAAAGLSINAENIDILRESMNKFANISVNDSVFQPKFQVDAMISADDVTFENITEINKLQPFGCGNFEPVFMMLDMNVVEIKLIGNTFKHLKMTLKKDGKLFDTIAFGMGDKYQDIINSKTIHIACYIQNNVWNGYSKIQLRILDIKYNLFKIINDSFFYSIDAVLPYFETNKKHPLKKESISFDADMLNENIFSYTKEKKRVAVLMNDIHTLIGIIKYLEMNQINCRIYAGNELVCCSLNVSVSYPDSDMLIFIMNPIPEKFMDLGSQQFVIAGTWTNRGYKNKIMSKLKEESISFVNLSNGCVCCKELVPSRQELRCIYQHIKTVCAKESYICTIVSLAFEFEKSYKLELDPFKFKKAIQIFCELNLISIEGVEENKIKIEIVKVTSKYNDLLVQSKTFNFLNSL